MRVLGLDLGTNSVGWALLEHPTPGRPPARMACGVYVFPEAVSEEKDGHFESNRHKRGEKRRQRRNLRRKRQRRDLLVRILLEHGMLPADRAERDALMSRHRDPGGLAVHPYALRKRGLDNPLTLHEFGRCLYHICRRRGYLSTAVLRVKRLSWLQPPVDALTEPTAVGDESGVTTTRERQRREEEGKLIARIRQTREKMREMGARSIGELHADLLAKGGYVRGIGGKRLVRMPGRKNDVFGYRADRALFEEEFHTLWDAQARHHPVLRRPDLKARVYRAIFHQRDLKAPDREPGRCELVPQRRRALRASLCNQRSVVLQYLTTLRLTDRATGEVRRLRGTEVDRLAAELGQADHLTWNQARGLLCLPTSVRFSDEREQTPARASGGSPRRQAGSQRGRVHIAGNRTAAAMRRALGDRWTDLRWEGPTRSGTAPTTTADCQEDLVTRLITARSFADVAAGLRRDYGFADEELYRLAVAELPEGYASHCTLVLKALEPHLHEGHGYWCACVRAGFRRLADGSEAPAGYCGCDHEDDLKFASTERTLDKALRRLGRLPDLRNPIVQRSAQAAFRVINAVLDRYGRPDRIRIEMPRDVSRTNADRDKTWAVQDRNAREREAAAEELRKNELPVTEPNMKKVRLWREAGLECPYEPGVPLNIHDAVDHCDIDHIVPQSRSLDDSWGNLTICPFALNQEKGGRTPFEAWGGTGRWQAIETHLATNHTLPYPKRQRIGRKNWDGADFPGRALSDTRYVSRLLLTEVKKLGYRPEEVEVSRGQLVALLRDAWELGGVVPLSEEEQAERDLFRAARKSALTAEQAADLRAIQRRRAAKPRSDHRHHALDAVLAALTDRSTFQALTAWFKEREEARKPPRPRPWPTIREDLERLIAGCPVIHAPTRQVRDKLHDEQPVPDADHARSRPAAPVDALAPDDGGKPGRKREHRWLKDALKALEAMTPDERARTRTLNVRNRYLVVLDEAGQPYKAYPLMRNHHVVIWESLLPGKDGKNTRKVTVVPMLEAARRGAHGEPVIRRTPEEGWRYVMALCENDIVEWTGDDPGLRRVAQFTTYPDGRPFITLRRLTDARADGKRATNITSYPGLRQVARRVVLGPLGDVITTEPAEER